MNTWHINSQSTETDYFMEHINAVAEDIYIGNESAIERNQLKYHYRILLSVNSSLQFCSCFCLVCWLTQCRMFLDSCLSRYHSYCQLLRARGIAPVPFWVPECALSEGCWRCWAHCVHPTGPRTTRKGQWKKIKEIAKKYAPTPTFVIWWWAGSSQFLCPKCRLGGGGGDCLPDEGPLTQLLWGMYERIPSLLCSVLSLCTLWPLFKLSQHKRLSTV